jgi:hypothetical protein
MIEPTIPEPEIFEFADAEKLFAPTELTASLTPVTEPSEGTCVVEPFPR